MSGGHGCLAHKPQQRKWAPAYSSTQYTYECGVLLIEEYYILSIELYRKYTCLFGSSVDNGVTLVHIKAKRQ